MPRKVVATCGAYEDAEKLFNGQVLFVVRQERRERRRPSRSGLHSGLAIRDSTIRDEVRVRQSSSVYWRSRLAPCCYQHIRTSGSNRYSLLQSRFCSQHDLRNRKDRGERDARTPKQATRLYLRSVWRSPVSWSSLAWVAPSLPSSLQPMPRHRRAFGC